MKRLVTQILAGAAVLLLLAAGCSGDKKGKFTVKEMESIPLAQRQGLPEASGGMVLSVNTEVVTADEMIRLMSPELKAAARGMPFEAFYPQMRPIMERAVMNRVTDILIYQEARTTAPENVDELLDKAVEKEVNKFVATFDGNAAKAQQAIEEMGYTWQTYREYQKKFLLTQSYVSEKMSEDKPIPRSELLERYHAMKDKHFSWDSTIDFQLIDIRPANMDSSLIREGETPEQAALRLANELMARLRAGEDFDEMAKQYSHGHRAAQGGHWKTVTVGSLAEPYDVIEKRAMQMQPGEIFGPIEAPEHLFILKLKQKQTAGYKPLDEVQDQIEAQIRVEQQRKTFDELVARLIEQARISDMERFVDYCVRRAWMEWNA